jgi:hypothetical protein
MIQSRKMDECGTYRVWGRGEKRFIQGFGGGNLRERLLSLGRRRGRWEDNLKMVDGRMTLKW